MGKSRKQITGNESTKIKSHPKRHKSKNFISCMPSRYTKINMEPEKHPFEKENSSSKHPFLGCTLIFQGFLFRRLKSSL